MKRHAALRLPASDLARLRLAHFTSGVDAPGQEFSAPASSPPQAAAEFTGFTEWLGAEDAGVSLGWDWIVTGCSGLMAVVPGTLRTNLVLTDAAGADLSEEATLACLADHLARWPWQEAVLAFLKSAPAQGDPG
jgi:hypothetical protein